MLLFTKTFTCTLKGSLGDIFAKIMAKIPIGAVRVVLELWCIDTNMFLTFLYQHKNYFTTPRRYQQTFVDFLQKYWRIIKYKEVEFQLFNTDLLFRGAKTSFEPRLILSVCVSLR